MTKNSNQSKTFNQSKKIQDKIKKLQQELKHKSTNFRGQKIPLKAIDNITEKINKHMDKLFHLSNQQAKEIKTAQTKKLIQEFNKAIQKQKSAGKYLDKKNKKIEKIIQDIENEIKKNN